MKNENLLSRRKFLSSAALGTGGILASNALPVHAEQSSSSAWVPHKQINQNIDNLRVVNCIDPAMAKADPKNWEFTDQNNPVVAEKVQRNMDAMACALAQKNDPKDAWATIFQKPVHKDWSTVKVAIKLNCMGKNNPRVAVVNSVCMALIGCGVAPENIMLYDGCGDAAALYVPYLGKGLVSGIKTSIKNESMGGLTEVSTPEPHKGKFKCTTALTNGSIDILVNIAVNKGHTVAGLTLTLKNHAGTFEPMPIHLGGGLKYIIAFNKTEAILGGAPVRQQLCIVDSIWAMTKGPFGVPNKRPNALSMGTFSPAVDYIVARRIRETIMGCKHPAEMSSIMSSFGYSNFENLDFINVVPA